MAQNAVHLVSCFQLGHLQVDMDIQKSLVLLLENKVEPTQNLMELTLGKVQVCG